MNIFGIAGYKNAGKTTLVTDLIGEFRARGLRVATVKHAHHAFDIDHPGKDSFLHREAGAQEVIVASVRRWAHIRELGADREPELPELLAHLSAAETDLVLVEGYKHGDHPKLELRRSVNDAPQLAGEDENIVAVVSDVLPENETVPCIARDDVSAIADFVLANAATLP